MRTPLLCLVALLITLSLHAQRNLSGSRQFSTYTYIYKLTAGEAGKLEDLPAEKIEEQLLHTLIDSFKTRQKPPTLPEGNYLLVHANQNRLVFKQHTPGNIQAKLVNNDHDIFVAVHTSEGLLVSDAKVKLDGKKLNFNKITRTYGPVARRQGEALITVLHNQVFYNFPVEFKPFRNATFLSRLLSPFRFRQKAKQKRYRSNYRNSFAYNLTPYEKKFKGFMVFSKPLYKPGDTVRLKAFVQHNSGTPVNRPLALRISDMSFETDTIIATIKPYRPGGYVYEFVLSDSLNLTLDQSYLVTLEESAAIKQLQRGRDDDFDEGHASRRKILMRGRFEHEEYELASINFSARSNKATHHRGEEVALFLKATDENELTVMDGRVEIIVLNNEYGNRLFFGKQVFIPDTLWTHSQPLESVGETTITLPDSIFPRASFQYSIQCIFLNSSNERKYQPLTQQYVYTTEEISFQIKNDSLQISYLSSGKPSATAATLYGLRGTDTVQQKKIQLPAIVKMHPLLTSYSVQAGEVFESYNIPYRAGGVSCMALRTKDSVTVQLYNPQRLPVWYTIFAGDKIIKRGLADSLLFAERSITPKNYFVSLQYIFRNEVYKENYTIPFQDKLLDIRVEQPEMIYPGQKVPVGIYVTDAMGKPVADADITAYSFTKKFSARSENIPYLGKWYPQRAAGRVATMEEQVEDGQSTKLNWQRWASEMSLDSIEYYKFLHPTGIYINTEAVPGNLTQLAPFVTIKGELQPVHLLYIDETPVFFSQASHLQRYSFPVSPGTHSLRLRTRTHTIKLDSIHIAAGMKTFISIEADTANRKIRLDSMPPALTEYEQALWSRYMILVENNFGENYAYIRQDGKHFLLNRSATQGPVLAGPLRDQHATLKVKNRLNQDFYPEGGWQFRIEQGLIKQKQLLNPQLFRAALPYGNAAVNFRDLVLTEREIDSLWQNYLDLRSSNTELFRNEPAYKYGNGRLQIGLSNDGSKKDLFLKNVILFRYGNADFIRIYPGLSRELGYLRPGQYRVMLLFKQNNYVIADSLEVTQNGINFYEISTTPLKPEDSVSKRIAASIENRTRDRITNYNDRELEEIKETFNSSYFDRATLTENISGVVTDLSGMPITGVSIVIKGTTMGTTTNAMGQFSLQTPAGGYLVINAVGFEQQQLQLSPGAYYNIILTPFENRLSEVVVVGYGSTMRKSLAGSVAGVSVTSDSRFIPIKIRGAVTETSLPMIIVDGLPFNGKLEDIPKDQIAKSSVLKNDEAMAIYGSMASAGAIVITTKKTASQNDEQPRPGNMLRSNFRDDAYWQPQLRTDANGYAGFTVTYPDDITNWRCFTIAWADKKRTGYAEGAVKSFKALSGKIALPQFAIEGDSINIIGKSLHYVPGFVTVNRTFSLNDKIINQGRINFQHSRIDTFAVTAPAGDSIKLKYTLSKDDGYFDGEQRSIPVFSPGVLETNGFFAALNHDTSFVLNMPADSGTVKLYAEASLLPVLYTETESIRNYEYLCNEQLASKLKAMLVQKRIDEFYKRPFKGEKNIKELINRLNNSRAAGNLWGWWPGTRPAMWISLHVAEALIDAERSGYTTSLNKTALADYIVFTLESYRGKEQLAGLYLLQQLGAKVDFKKYIDSLEKKQSSFYERLRLTELRQLVKLPVVTDTLIAKQNRTVFGNIYWGNDNYEFFDNSIQLTLAMYRILRNTGRHPDLLRKIRNYFLEKRKNGNWRNTYESSLILETILPDLLAENSHGGPATLTVKGQPTIRNFPYSINLKTADKISISKGGSMPLYLTAYQQHWNPRPEKLDGNFKVTTGFHQNGQEASRLRAGVPATITASVTVAVDADYVMVEIPIPAGCSYGNKMQTYRNHEVHREYFKNKVSIFCERLPKGVYEFEVELLPRFTGNYTLNPAKAEMMYFPLFNGREGIRRVAIQ